MQSGNKYYLENPKSSYGYVQLSKIGKEYLVISSIGNRGTNIHYQTQKFSSFEQVENYIYAQIKYVETYTKQSIQTNFSFINSVGLFTKNYPLNFTPL